jgi:hypothetical protein
MIKRLKNRAPVNTTSGNKSVSTVKDTPKKKKEKTAKLCHWRTFLMVLGVTLGISAFNNFLMTQVDLTPDATTINPTMMSQHLLEKAQNLSGALGSNLSGLFEATERPNVNSDPIIYKCDAQRTKGDPTSPGYFLPVFSGLLNEG